LLAITEFPNLLWVVEGVVLPDVTKDGAAVNGVPVTTVEAAVVACSVRALDDAPVLIDVTGDAVDAEADAEDNDVDAGISEDETYETEQKWSRAFNRFASGPELECCRWCSYTSTNLDYMQQFCFYCFQLLTVWHTYIA
jgi:hypothetical protein